MEVSRSIAALDLAGLPQVSKKNERETRINDYMVAAGHDQLYGGRDRLTRELNLDCSKTMVEYFEGVDRYLDENAETLMRLAQDLNRE